MACPKSEISPQSAAAAPNFSREHLSQFSPRMGVGSINLPASTLPRHPSSAPLTPIVNILSTYIWPAGHLATQAASAAVKFWWLHIAIFQWWCRVYQGGRVVKISAAQSREASEWRRQQCRRRFCFHFFIHHQRGSTCQCPAKRCNCATHCALSTHSPVLLNSSLPLHCCALKSLQRCAAANGWRQCRPGNVRAVRKI